MIQHVYRYIFTHQLKFYFSPSIDVGKCSQAKNAECKIVLIIIIIIIIIIIMIIDI